MASKTFSFAMLSHPGRVRKGNEDTCAASTDPGVFGAFAVCDGMGGAAAGEVASRLAAETFLKTLTPVKGETPRTATPDARLDAAIHAANQAVFQKSRRLPEMQGMGTTIVALLLEISALASRPALTLAHVGDSRCYLFRADTLALLTQDHSLVEEQVRLGELSASEAERHPMRNIITRAVGSQASVEPEIRNLDTLPDDLYLLASDGLTRELSELAIAQAFRRFLARETIRNRAGKPDLTILAQTLVDQANDAGGADNVTVLLLHVP